MIRLEDLADDMCLWCGGEIDRSRPHADRRKYCSDACCTAHAVDIDKEARIAAKVALNRHCVVCGSAIPVSRPLGAKYCSFRCSRSGSRPVPAKRYPLTCEHCGSAFFGQNPAQRFCSPACVNADRRQREAAKRVRACIDCGVEFTVSRSHSAGLRCPSCLSKRRIAQLWEGRDLAHSRRRAKRKPEEITT